MQRSIKASMETGNEDTMSKRETDVACRKCGSQAAFAMTPSMLCCVVRCSKCGESTEPCCSYDEAENEWKRMNAGEVRVKA